MQCCWIQGHRSHGKPEALPRKALSVTQGRGSRPPAAPAALAGTLWGWACRGGQASRRTAIRQQRGQRAGGACGVRTGQGGAWTLWRLFSLNNPPHPQKLRQGPGGTVSLPGRTRCRPTPTSAPPRLPPARASRQWPPAGVRRAIVSLRRVRLRCRATCWTHLFSTPSLTS